jgi:hypothetical protein
MTDQPTYEPLDELPDDLPPTRQVRRPPTPSPSADATRHMTGWSDRMRRFGGSDCK